MGLNGFSRTQVMKITCHCIIYMVVQAYDGIMMFQPHLRVNPYDGVVLIIEMGCMTIIDLVINDVITWLNKL